ncbi:MAG TPA: C25 family cysteine peptidase [Blastocatellia bacterium]|nr:C25 family cysteine peptidase [Blastocatellia bacterium]
MGKFKITFLGVTCTEETSTWCYSVKWFGGGPALSHLTIGVCEDLECDDLVRATIDGSTTHNASLGPDGSTGIYGVKFDPPGSFSPGQTRTYCFTLRRKDLTVGPVSYVAKAGPNKTPSIICGPTCPEAPTLARLNSFRAVMHEDGRVELNWETGFEADNLGFNIYRDSGSSRTLITPDPVAGSALLAASQGIPLQAGFSYSWSDSLPPNARDVQYWIEDIDLNGSSSFHGPFALESADPSSRFSSPGKRSPLLSHLGKLSQTASSSSFFSASAPVGLSAPLVSPSHSLLAAAPSLASAQAVKISVRQTGLYRISQQQLLAAGLPPSVNPRFLQMYVNGQQLPIIVRGESDSRLDPSDSVEFFAVGLDSSFTKDRVYWLVAGSQPGLRINSPASSKGKGGPPAGGRMPKKSLTISSGSFPFSVERRDKIFFFSSLLNGEQDNFFGSLVSSNPLDQSLLLSNVDFNSGSDALLEITLQGVTLVPHQVAVWLNDHSLGSISFSNRDKGTLSIAVPHSLLKEGQNIVRLARQAGSSDLSLVEAIRISYQHTARADSDQLLFSAHQGQTVSISGFSSPNIQLLDVTDPDNVEALSATVSQDASGSFAVTATVTGSESRKLFAVADTQILAPHSIKANKPSNLRSPSNGASLLIITRSDLVASLSQLKAYRQSQGHAVSIIDVEDIYDEFAFGHKTPFAIRDFLAATQSWKRAPRYVLLAGDGTYDPRDNVGGGAGDVIPIKLVETETMETASDDWYVDFDEDTLADMAIGRLPVRTPGEVLQMTEKIIRYERKGRTSGALLVSDAPDGLFDFEEATAKVRELIPTHERVEEVYRGQLGDSIARARVLEGIRQGPKVVNYVGHGTLTNWKANLLHASDAGVLGNEENPTLMVSMTCLNGLFQNPTGASLAEAMIGAKGGAVAVWASSGLTGPRNQALMNQEVIRQLFKPGTTTIGDATRAAKALVLDHNVRRIWILFGDPTTRIK